MKRTCAIRYVLIGVGLMWLCGTAAAWAQQSDSTAVADSLLIQELARELEAMSPGTPPPAQAVSRSRPTTNPDISVIGDVAAWYTSEGDRNIDAAFREAEFTFKSFVDPYARAEFYVAAHQEDGEVAFELEEAFLTTLSLPARLQLKAGKFRSAFGKINRIHPHALPYPDVASVYANYLGEEGLNDQGVSLSWLLPNASFYQELTVEVTRGPDHNESFDASEGNRLLYVGHLKNFWDLTDNATLEVGFSAAAGPNEEGFTSWLGGTNLTYKWKPIRFNTYRSFTLQAEAFVSRKESSPTERIKTWGGYALANVQLGRRWYLIGRYDHSDLPDNPAWDEQALSATLSWYATEFQKIELSFKTSTGNEFDRINQALLRAIFVIGTHGAHEY